LWKNLKSSTNTTQLDLKSESQTAFIHTLTNEGPKINPYGNQTNWCMKGREWEKIN
jgi:hypothetical protein